MDTIIQLALAPVGSLLLCLALPASFIAAYLLYSCTCRSRRGARPYTKEILVGSGRGAPSILAAIGAYIWTNLPLILIGCIYIYAQCTLLRHLYEEERHNLSAANRTKIFCDDTISHPGRHTHYITPGCQQASRDIEVDCLSEAIRRWTVLFFSLGLPQLQIFATNKEDPVAEKNASLNVTVPFGIGRLALIIIVILFVRKWLSPAVTLVQSGVNRLRTGPLSAKAA